MLLSFINIHIDILRKNVLSTHISGKLVVGGRPQFLAMCFSLEGRILMIWPLISFRLSDPRGINTELAMSFCDLASDITLLVTRSFHVSIVGTTPETMNTKK